MTQVRNVAVIVGSLRKDSVSRKLARAFAALTPSLKFDIVEIGDLPHFDQDLESDPPAEWVRFREQIAAADAVLFVTPE
jgi:chromate reductase